MPSLRYGCPEPLRELSIVICSLYVYLLPAQVNDLILSEECRLDLPRHVVCLQINEGLLATFEQCGQKYAHDEVAGSQQTVGTAEEAVSPFRIKRKDGQSKKGALGFKPLLRSSSKPPSSAPQEGKPNSASPRLPDRHGHGVALPAQQPLSPSAFRTPAVTRANHTFMDTAQITSGMLIHHSMQLSTVLLPQTLSQRAMLCSTEQ